MTRIAIGNDFNVRWSLSQLGQPYNLADKEITITLKSAYSEQDITNILVSDNVITFEFPAEEQIYIAKYDIILRIEESPDTWTVKLCDAFELVACGSCAYITQDDCNVTTITTDGQTIEFESQIVYPSNGMSAYELAKASGEYTGDYEGYQKWLAGLNGGGGGQGGGASTWDELEGKPENLVVAEATDEEVEEAEGVPNVKYVAQSLTAEQQEQARENIGGAEATPSGDPMHYAYESAGAVWNGESWQADQRKGLTNEQVRQLFLKEDMSEMLFRKMWNMAGARIPYCPGYYDEATGFYRVNGVWHMTYEEALEVYVVTHNNNDSLWGMSPQRPVIVPITTMPFVGNRARPGFPCIVWAQRIVEHRTELYTHNMGDGTWYDTEYSDFSLGYCPNLRTMRDTYNLYGKSNYTTIDLGRMSSFLHCNLRIDRALNPLTYTFERLSYYSLHYSLSNTRYASTLKLHPTVYGFVTGTINPEELSKEPIRPEYADYDLIPYQQNLKVVPDNAFWREELDVKGINGEYIYPSFTEYLANNPSNFATAAEWQALATLAQEKNVTLVQG